MRQLRRWLQLARRRLRVDSLHRWAMVMLRVESLLRWAMRRGGFSHGRCRRREPPPAPPEPPPMSAQKQQLMQQWMQMD